MYFLHLVPHDIIAKKGLLAVVCISRLFKSLTHARCYVPTGLNSGQQNFYMYMPGSNQFSLLTYTHTPTHPHTHTHTHTHIRTHTLHTHTYTHTLYTHTHTHTHAVTATDQEKSPTAEDFTDITEVAEDETPVPTAAATGSTSGSEAGGAVRGDLSSNSERLLQKGISFAQSQLAGTGMCVSVSTPPLPSPPLPSPSLRPCFGCKLPVTSFVPERSLFLFTATS